MAGAYCKFCNQRCFVYRVLPDRSWAGHLATCLEGMAHDRSVTGYDHTTAVNPLMEHEVYTFQVFEIHDEFGVPLPLSPPLTYIRQGPPDPRTALTEIVQRITSNPVLKNRASTTDLRVDIWVGYDASTDQSPLRSAEITPTP
jgi:hypothetical protein